MVLAEWIEEWADPNPQMWVHTSGSTGAPKPLLVEKRRLEASAPATPPYSVSRFGISVVR